MLQQQQVYKHITSSGQQNLDIYETFERDF